MPIPNQPYRQPIFDDELLSLEYFVNQIVNKIETVTLVKVVKIYNADGVEPVGLVDVQPLIQQLNYDGSTTDHGIIHKIPYFRLQGGSNAIIIDPKVGDIGMCGFCSRDSRGVINTKSTASPQTLRQYDLSDGLYIGGMLNGTPTQYIQFSKDGIVLKSPNKVTIDAPETEITGNLTVGGLATSLVDFVAKSISLIHHLHGRVKSGDSNTGSPQ